MNDRELLEMAAKASGNTVYSAAGLGVRSVMHWNPLTDDGDALRLAVKLGLHARICRRMTLVEMREAGDDICEPHGADIYAATRRAIVRAAAAIGEGLAPFPTADQIRGDWT